MVQVVLMAAAILAFAVAAVVLYALTRPRPQNRLPRTEPRRAGDGENGDAGQTR
jgi:hypothetical protein